MHERMRTLIAALLVATPLHAAKYSGSVNKVVDGDTFWLCDDTGCYKFRVCGINTPERGEPGYAESKTALATIVKGKPVRCVLVGGGTPCDGKSKPASSDRFVAQCFAQASDIARTMVEQGFACDKLSSREATTPKGETATLARRACKRAHQSFGSCGLSDFSVGVYLNPRNRTLLDVPYAKQVHPDACGAGGRLFLITHSPRTL